MSTVVQAPQQAPQTPPPSLHRHGRGRLFWRNTAQGWSFILPNFIGFAVITMVPIGYLFYLSFTSLNAFMRGEFVGFNNYARLWSDPAFWNAFWNTVYYAALHIPLTLGAALGLAVLLNRGLRGVSFFRTAAFFPYITSLVALVAVWRILLYPGSTAQNNLDSGPVNAFLRFLGVDNPPGWMSSIDWSLPTIALVGTWRDMGYYMVLFLAGLQTIPQHLYEAAKVDGASPWQRFRHVTVPGLRHTFFFVTVILTINSLKIFDLVLVMTDGGPGRSSVVLSQYIWQKGFDSDYGIFEFGYASAISVVLFFVCLLLTFLQYFINRRANR